MKTTPEQLKRLVNEQHAVISRLRGALDAEVESSNTLRAELAAERESATNANLDFVKMLRRADALEAERGALRELLVEARHEWLGSCQIGSARAALRLDVFMSRIDAALNEGGGK